MLRFALHDKYALGYVTNHGDKTLVLGCVTKHLRSVLRSYRLRGQQRL
jgi:hypothetical protein